MKSRTPKQPQFITAVIEGDEQVGLPPRHVRIPNSPKHRAVLKAIAQLQSDEGRRSLAARDAAKLASEICGKRVSVALAKDVCDRCFDRCYGLDEVLARGDPAEIAQRSEELTSAVSAFEKFRKEKFGEVKQ